LFASTISLKVLEGLLEESDDDEEIWYLLGYMYYLRGTEFYQIAKYYVAASVKVRQIDNFQQVSRDFPFLKYSATALK
jgi:uncharacterized protein HemY